MKTLEDEARELLERAGFDPSKATAGELVEIANLIQRDRDRENQAGIANERHTRPAESQDTSQRRPINPGAAWPFPPPIKKD